MPLNLMVERQAGGGLSLQLMHDLRYFSAAQAQLRLDMLAHTLSILPGLIDTPLTQIDTLPQGLRDSLLQGGLTPLAQEDPPSVMRSILGHAAAHPDPIAVVHGKPHLSLSDFLASAVDVANQHRPAARRVGEEGDSPVRPC